MKVHHLAAMLNEHAPHDRITHIYTQTEDGIKRYTMFAYGEVLLGVDTEARIPPAHGIGPCAYCGGSGVRCCEFGRDSE